MSGHKKRIHRGRVRPMTTEDKQRRLAKYKRRKTKGNSRAARLWAREHVKGKM
jgi:hypothetical protein